MNIIKKYYYVLYITILIYNYKINLRKVNNKSNFVNNAFFQENLLISLQNTVSQSCILPL